MLGAPSPAVSDLSLWTVAARAKRSVVRVGEPSGFVAWANRGAALVVAAGAYRRGEELALEQGTRSWVGAVVRVDGERELALLRVEDASIGPAL